MRRQISQPPQDATEDKGLNVGTSAQKAIKTGMQSPFQKKTQLVERLLRARPHICARPWQKATIESDSSKVEVVGKKTSASSKKNRPVFNAAVAACVYPSAARRALSLTVDRFPVRSVFSSSQTRIHPDLKCASFVRVEGKKTADDARFSPTAQPTCRPSCSNTPEKQLQNVK